jgi:ubiquinone/menaquinone biosynthesis C-methylase UbiE
MPGTADQNVPVPPGRTAAAYQEQAPSYSRNTGAFQPYREAIVDTLPLSAGDVVLDVGCGTGLCCGLLR